VPDEGPQHPRHKVGASITVLATVYCGRSRAAKLAGLALVLSLAGASAAIASPSKPNRSQRLRIAAQRLDTRAHQALLELYALDTRLSAARAQVATLEARAAKLQAERATLQTELATDERTLESSQRELAIRLRALYEQGTVDPVAVLLGASSLGSGLQRLDDLSRLADEGRKVVAATRAARSRLVHARGRLARQARHLSASVAAARTAEGSLASTVSARLGYVSRLRSQAQLRRSELQGILQKAQTAQQKSQKLTGGDPAPPPTSGRKLVVSATCYDLPGHTATGMPVGWGVVAVDPNVIPLGTKIHVPGYGDAVAADVGSAIKGARIDVWMPYTQCMQWGRRTVTITIY